MWKSSKRCTVLFVDCYALILFAHDFMTPKIFSRWQTRAIIEISCTPEHHKNASYESCEVKRPDEIVVRNIDEVFELDHVPGGGGGC